MGEMEDEGPHDEGEFSFAEDVGELDPEAAFGVGVEAGRDMVKDELEKLLQDLEEPYAAGMPDEGELHDQPCEKVHPGEPHTTPHMRDY